MIETRAILIGLIVVLGILGSVIIYFSNKILKSLPNQENNANDTDDIEKAITKTEGKIDTISANINSLTNTLGGVATATSSNQTNYNSMIRKITDIERLFATNQVRGKIGENTVERIIEWVGLKDGKGKYWDKKVPEGDCEPDFTFYFPDGAYVHLDSKFPYDNYKEMIKCDPKSPEEDTYKKSFKQNIQAIKREYLKPEKRQAYINHGGKINFLMIFIPNMQIVNFIREEFDDLDESFASNDMLLLGPSELYAILQFLNRAIDNYRIEDSASEIISLIKDFEREWFDNMLPKIQELRKQFNTSDKTLTEIEGARTKKLTGVMNKIKNNSEDSLDIEEE
ncbi:MAG TPA: DNA recombination protein RmuC [Candidatus Marinimicrobia bacterium]|nr:DNA recombination protein RmuC [Candidatus Neomarinimicrobiota bacterium]|tara:strand:- start:4061 stop:5077 length:1017 start_codon:yes stop_codon:yes gene_type:complete